MEILDLICLGGGVIIFLPGERFWPGNKIYNMIIPTLLAFFHNSGQKMVEIGIGFTKIQIT